MYVSSPTKKLILSNFMAVPLFKGSLFDNNLWGLIPTVLSVIFCLIALGEIIHIVWNHFHPDESWE